jgi:hypothetical protein
MKCTQCEEDKKIYKGSPRIQGGDYKKAWEALNKKLEYLTYQCETKTQLKPVKLAPITRYACSNKHSWSIENARH